MTPYERGRALEYKIKKQLEDEGYEVSRTAGSHSKWDLIAIRDGEIRLIQLKRVAYGKKSSTEVTRGEATFTKELWIVADKRRGRVQ